MEHQILTLYVKGMSNREIEDFIKNMYGTEVSPSVIFRITDRILLEVREWQSWPLKRLYAMVFMDAIHDHVRKEGSVVNKAVYIAIGIDMSGCKDVLGLYIGEVQTSKFWLSVMNERYRRYTDLFRRWLEWLFTSNYSGISKGYCTKLHRPSNPQ